MTRASHQNRATLVTSREQQLLDLIAESTDVIYETTAQGFFTYVNAAVRDVLGYEPEQLIGAHYADLVADEARERTVRLYRWQLESKTGSTYFEFPAMTSDRRIVWFGQSVQAVIENDQVVGFRAIARDITDRWLAQRERQAAEERFRLFMDNSPAIAFMKDARGKLVYVNKQMDEMFSGARETIVGAHDVELLPLDSSEIQRNDEEVLRGRKSIQVVESLPTADGQMRHWLSCKFPVQASDGALYVGAVAIDLTERLALENELAAARDAALDSARQKSEFLANMSHEIRTPMNGVLGLLGVLLDSELTADQRDLAETARSNAEALLTIINDILDYSKIEAGKLTFEMLEMDVRNTVDSVLELLSDAARKKGLDMGSVVDRDVPAVVRGDPARFRQVLFNLIGNAIKFTSDGGVLVQVDLESSTDDSVVLRCRVTDTGIGISTQTQQRLFQPFVQADSSTTRQFGGTGLGLAISRQLVRMMDGEIAVESEPDCGSSFWFTARFGRAASVSMDAEPTHHTYSIPRVLAVDDSATTRQILSLQLTTLGIQNDIADDSLAALTMIRQAAAAGRPFDVVISDLNMPRVNGITLARLVKEDPSLGSPRFILITASSPRFDAAVLAQLGVTACLTKPASPKKLFPLLFGESAQDARKPTAPQRAKRAVAMSDRPRVLVVDDNAVNQKVALRQLEKLGYAADAVANGVEAIEALDRIAYHAVLMDCQMPVMDGFQAAGEIRRRERGSVHRTPIIALTAGVTAKDRRRCLEAGMDDFVTKPTRQTDLQAALQRSLKENACTNTM